MIGKDVIETSQGHKKEHNGTLHEAPLDKLSTVDCDKQTLKGKKVLEEITEKSTTNL